MQSRGKMSGGDAVNAVTSGNLLSMPVWKVRYPYNPKQVTKYSLSPEVVDLIAFCTKNPLPMLPFFDKLKPYGQWKSKGTGNFRANNAWCEKQDEEWVGVPSKWKAGEQCSIKRMTGGRVIEANTDFYRYLICHLPSASIWNSEKRLRTACKLQSNEI